MFFEYNQNNSYGTFDFDEKRGISHHVIIEANNNVEADEIAQKIGIYFEGVDSGADCPCCGDRWYPASSNEKYEYPNIYELALDREIAPKILVAGKSPYLFKWLKDRPEIFVHYKDGTKVGFYIEESDMIASEK